MSRAYNFCNNCGENGHAFHQCRKPITSTGMIVFKKSKNEELKYLMICRKDSLGFVDFMRGKYQTHDPAYIRNIFNEMTVHERDKIKTMDFDELWKDLWGENIGIQYRGEERISRDKFKRLTNGIMSNDQYYTIESIIEDSTRNGKYQNGVFQKEDVIIKKKIYLVLFESLRKKQVIAHLL